MAAGIPGARFVPLESRNHILTETEAAWPMFADISREFLNRAMAGTALHGVKLNVTDGDFSYEFQ